MSTETDRRRIFDETVSEIPKDYIEYASFSQLLTELGKRTNNFLLVFEMDSKDKWFVFNDIKTKGSYATQLGLTMWAKEKILSELEYESP